MPILIPTNSFVKQQFIKNNLGYSADINADLCTCLIGAAESRLNFIGFAKQLNDIFSRNGEISNASPEFAEFCVNDSFIFYS